ncbi:MAG TPA: glycoside hydrolase family 3 N-terminal domain-containing protein [Longimicrobiales bacterium]|nr:glycoside hydrolase family 3 N-terminal domain-containing protein [Longimicrobiales bacterium]
MQASLRVLAVLSLAACASAPPAVPEGPAGAPPVAEEPMSADDWVQTTLAGMSLREKVGQLVMPRISGDYMAEDSRRFARARSWVTDQKIGGVIVSIGPPYEIAAKLNVLQRISDVPLLVSADMEHGPGQILRGGTVLPYGIETGSATRFPPLMGIGATGEERFARELGRITALEARAAGVHIAFAPVVDVNNNPNNPIINVRSYGADPQLVARFGVAHVEGLQDNGMIATVKHFPGHGDTGRDSHIEPLMISVDRARAEQVELVPFRAAIDAGVGAFMSAHIAFPALTGDSIPATLNPKLLRGLLREEFGFDGLIFTDALDMGAIVREFSADDAPVLALAAGADMLLQVMPDDVERVIDSVVRAVEAGRLPMAQLDASVRRVLEAKAQLGLHHERMVDLDRLDNVLAIDEHVDIAQAAADRSITLVRDEGSLVPLRGRVLSVVYSDDYDPMAGRIFQRELFAGNDQVRTAQLDRRSSAADIAALQARADSFDIVVFAPFISVAAYKGGLALPPEVANAVNAISTTTPVVVTSFGNPYLLSQLPGVQGYVLAWGGWDAPQRAAARALLGQTEITGRLPIPLPPQYPIGHGLQRTSVSTQ